MSNSEDEENIPNKSEWNEQQLFSNLFFQLTAECRVAQAQGNITSWFMALTSKISLVMGIITDEEKTRLKDLERFMAKCNYNYRQTKGKKEYNHLWYALFDSEGEIDTITNKHMPFLNLKKNVDIGNF